MTTVYLIRHGETKNNTEMRCNGQRTNQSLSERGRAQATALSAYFKENHVDRVYASDLERAKETAMLAFRLPEEAITLDKGLREVNLGDWDGVPYAEAAARYPELWAGRTEAAVSTRFPGGESVTEAADRIFSAFLRLVRAHKGERIAIVAHEMILVLLLLRIFQKKLTERRFMGGISNTGFDLLQIDEAGHATMQLWNFTDHLTEDLYNEADYATDFDRVAADCREGGMLPL